MLPPTSRVLRDLLLVSCLTISTNTLVLAFELSCRPRLRYPFKDQFIPLARQDRHFQFTLLRDTFELPASCSNSPSSVSWHVQLISSHQSAWLAFDSNTWTLSGTPPAANVGQHRMYLQVQPQFTPSLQQHSITPSCHPASSSSSSSSSSPPRHDCNSATFELDLRIISSSESVHYPETERLWEESGDRLALQHISLPPLSLLPSLQRQQHQRWLSIPSQPAHSGHQRQSDNDDDDGTRDSRNVSQINGPETMDSSLVQEKESGHHYFAPNSDSLSSTLSKRSIQPNLELGISPGGATMSPSFSSSTPSSSLLEASSTLTRTTKLSSWLSKRSDSLADAVVLQGQDIPFIIRLDPTTFSTSSSAVSAQTVTYAARLKSTAALPPWLQFNPSTLEFSGVPPPGTYRSTMILTIVVSATTLPDGYSLATSSFRLKVAVHTLTLTHFGPQFKTSERGGDGDHISTYLPDLYLDPRERKVNFEFSMDYFRMDGSIRPLHGNQAATAEVALANGAPSKGMSVSDMSIGVNANGAVTQTNKGHKNNVASSSLIEQELPIQQNHSISSGQSTGAPAITSITISVGNDNGAGVMSETPAPAWLHWDPILWKMTGSVPLDVSFRILVLAHVQDSYGTTAMFKLQIFPNGSGYSDIEAAHKYALALGDGDGSMKDQDVLTKVDEKKFEHAPFNFSTTIPDQWVKINEPLKLELDVASYVHMPSDPNVWPIESTFAFEALDLGSPNLVNANATATTIVKSKGNIGNMVTLKPSLYPSSSASTPSSGDNIHSCQVSQLWDDDGPLFPRWFHHTPHLYGPKPLPSLSPSASSTGTVVTLSGEIPCSLTLRIRWTLRNANAQWTATEFLLWVSKDGPDPGIVQSLWRRGANTDGDGVSDSSGGSSGGSRGVQIVIGLSVAIPVILVIWFIVMRYCRSARHERAQLEGAKQYIDLESAAATTSMTGSRLGGSGDGRSTPMAASIRGSESVPSRPISTYDTTGAGSSAAVLLLAGAGARGSFHGGEIASGATSINDGGTPRPSRVGGARPEYDETGKLEHHPLHPQLERLQQELQQHQHSPQTPNSGTHVRIESPTATPSSGLSSKFYKLYSKMNATDYHGENNTSPTDAGDGGSGVGGAGTSRGPASAGGGSGSASGSNSPKRRGSMPGLDQNIFHSVGRTRSLFGWIASMRRERSSSLSGIEFNDTQVKHGATSNVGDQYQVGDDPYRMRERQPNPLALKRISMGFPFDTLRPRASQQTISISDLATTDRASSIGGKRRSGTKSAKTSRQSKQQTASASEVTSHMAQSRQVTAITVDRSASVQGSNVGSLAAGAQSNQVSEIGGSGSPSCRHQHHCLSQHHQVSPLYLQEQSPRRHSMHHQNSPRRDNHHYQSPHHQSPIHEHLHPHHHPLQSPLYSRPEDEAFVLATAAPMEGQDENSTSESTSIFHRFNRKPTARQTRQARREQRRMSTNSERLHVGGDMSQRSSYYSSSMNNTRRHSTVDHLSPNFVLRQSRRPLSSYESIGASSGYVASVSGGETSCAESDYDDSRRQSAYSVGGSGGGSHYQHPLDGGWPYRAPRELDADEFMQQLEVKMQAIGPHTHEERRSSYLSVHSACTRDGMSRRQSLVMLDYGDHDQERLQVTNLDIMDEDRNVRSLREPAPYRDARTLSVHTMPGSLQRRSLVDALQANEAPLSPLSALSASLPSWNPFKADLECQRRASVMTATAYISKAHTPTTTILGDEPKDVIAHERYLRRPQHFNPHEKGLRSYYSEGELSDRRIETSAATASNAGNILGSIMENSHIVVGHAPYLPDGDGIIQPLERAKLIDVPSHQPRRSSFIDDHTLAVYDDDSRHPHDLSSEGETSLRSREYVRRAHESLHGVVVIQGSPPSTSSDQLNDTMAAAADMNSVTPWQQQQPHRPHSAHLPLSYSVTTPQNNHEDVCYSHYGDYPHSQTSSSSSLAALACVEPGSSRHRHSVALHQLYPSSLSQNRFSSSDDHEFIVDEHPLEEDEEDYEFGERNHMQENNGGGTSSTSTCASHIIRPHHPSYRSIRHRRSESSMRTTSTQSTLFHPNLGASAPSQMRRHTVGFEKAYIMTNFKDSGEDTTWSTPSSAVLKSPSTSVPLATAIPVSESDDCVPPQTYDLQLSQKHEHNHEERQSQVDEGLKEQECKHEEEKGERKAVNSLPAYRMCNDRLEQQQQCPSRPLSYPTLLNSSTSTLLDSPTASSSTPSITGSQTYTFGLGYPSQEAFASAAAATAAAMAAVARTAEEDEPTPMPTVRPRSNLPRPSSIATIASITSSRQGQPNIVKATIGTAFHYTANLRYNGFFGSSGGIGGGSPASRRTSSNGSIFGGGFGFGTYGSGGPGTRASICLPTTGSMPHFGRVDEEQDEHRRRHHGSGFSAPGSRMSLAGPPTPGKGYGTPYFSGPRPSPRSRSELVASRPPSLYIGTNDRETSLRRAMGAAKGEFKAYLVSDPHDHYMEKVRLREQEGLSQNRMSLESNQSDGQQSSVFSYQDSSTRGLLNDPSTQSPTMQDSPPTFSTTTLSLQEPLPTPPAPGRKRKLPSWIQYNSKMQSLWGRPIPGTAGEWQVSLVHSLPSLPSSPATSTPGGTNGIGGVGMSASLSMPGGLGGSGHSSAMESTPIQPRLSFYHQLPQQQPPAICSNRRRSQLELRRSLYLEEAESTSPTSAAPTSGVAAGAPSTSSCYAIDMDASRGRPRLSIDGDSMKGSESSHSSNDGNMEVEVERVLLIVREPAPKSSPFDSCLGSYDKQSYGDDSRSGASGSSYRHSLVNGHHPQYVHGNQQTSGPGSLLSGSINCESATGNNNSTESLVNVQGSEQQQEEEEDEGEEASSKDQDPTTITPTLPPPSSPSHSSVSPQMTVHTPTSNLTTTLAAVNSMKSPSPPCMRSSSPAKEGNNAPTSSAAAKAKLLVPAIQTRPSTLSNLSSFSVGDSSSTDSASAPSASTIQPPTTSSCLFESSASTSATSALPSGAAILRSPALSPAATTANTNASHMHSTSNSGFNFFSSVSPSSTVAEKRAFFATKANASPAVSSISSVSAATNASGGGSNSGYHPYSYQQYQHHPHHHGQGHISINMMASSAPATSSVSMQSHHSHHSHYSNHSHHSHHSGPAQLTHTRKDSLPSSPTFSNWLPAPLPLPMPPASTILLKPTNITAAGGEYLPHRSYNMMGSSQPTSPIAIQSPNKNWVQHSVSMPTMAGASASSPRAPTPPASAGHAAAFSNHSNNPMTPGGNGGSYNGGGGPQTPGRTIGQRVLAERMRIEAALRKNSQNLSTTPPGRSFLRRD